MLIYSKKKPSGFQSLQSTKTLLDLNITASSVSDSTGIHTLTLTNTSFNTTINKNGVASVRIPRTGRIHTNTPSAGDNLRIDADAWNISTWVYFVTTGTHNILSELAGSNFYPALFLSGGFYIGDGLSNKLNIALTPPTNQWTHINSSWDGTNYRLHINGSLTSKTSNSSMRVLETAGWEMGTRSSQGFTSDLYLGSMKIDRGIAATDASFTP